MKLRFTLLFSALLCAHFVQAQSFSERLILHRGFSLGMFTSPAAKFTETPIPGQQFTNSYEYPASTSLFYGLNWGGRFNVYELSAERTISIHASVIGSGYISSAFLQSDPGDVMGDFGYALQIPITVNYNIGHLASRSSSAERGFVIGAGLEINRLFSVWEREESYKNYSFYSGVAEEGAWNYMQPVLNIGYRYWNSNDSPRELNLQIGFGARDQLSFGTFARPSARLSLLKYINY